MEENTKEASLVPACNHLATHEYITSYTKYKKSGGFIWKHVVCPKCNTIFVTQVGKYEKDRAGDSPKESPKGGDTDGKDKKGT